MTSLWKITTPDVEGLYIASTSRKAGWVRYWTGKHWSSPTAVYDMNDPTRVPTAASGPADLDRGERIVWLEPFEMDADGFIRWSGENGIPPIPPDMRVEVRLRNAMQGDATEAKLWTWSHEGGDTDIVAYRPLTLEEVRAERAAAAAENDKKQFDPKDIDDVRKAPTAYPRAVSNRPALSPKAEGPLLRIAKNVASAPIAVDSDTAAAMLGNIARSTFLEQVSRGKLPKPRKIGRRSVWLVEDLEAAARGLFEEDTRPLRMTE